MRLDLSKVEAIESKAGGNNYGEDGHAKWFSIHNDGERRVVRFLLKGVDDVDFFSVHNVKINGRNRWVNCLRETADAPISDCPFCAHGDRARIRAFIQLIDEDGELAVWDRPAVVVRQLRGLLQHIQGPLYNTPVEITRIGAPGSKNTQYVFHETQPKPVSDDILNTRLDAKRFVLNKSAEDISHYLDNGDFPGYDKGQLNNNHRPTPRTTKVDVPSYGQSAKHEEVSKPAPDISKPVVDSKPTITPTVNRPVVEVQVPTRQPVSEDKIPSDDTPLPRRHPREF